MAAFSEELKQATLQALQSAADVPESVMRLLRDAVLGVPDRLPFPRDQQIQVRDALISAMADVAKMLGGVSRE